MEIMRRELELLRARLSAINSTRYTHDAPRAHVSTETGWIQNKVSLNVIAELLPEFDGTMGDFRIWRNKLKILERTYQLNDNHMKILVGLRLRGKALAWLHSADEYMLLSTEELLKGLGAMFDQLDSMVLHNRFRARKWRKDESFSDYMHEKIILGNRVPIAEEQLLEYIIDGIRHWGLRSNIRISGVSTKEELRARLENVEHWDRKDKTEGDAGRYQPRSRDQDSKAGTSKPEEGRGNRGGRREQRQRSCFSCGLPNHVSRDCPTKTQGPKCYKCGERGHVASKCVEQLKTVSIVDTRIARKKYVKEVSIRGRKIEALFGTGSDISLMRAAQYVRIGAPKLGEKTIRFCGIGADNFFNETLGEFDTVVNIDGRDYPMHVHVVADELMEHELLLGADFLDSVRVTIDAGKIIIEASKSRRFAKYVN